VATFPFFFAAARVHLGGPGVDGPASASLGGRVGMGSMLRGLGLWLSCVRNGEELGWS
jgi:hypothetical protein